MSIPINIIIIQIGSLLQNSSNSIANALELLQSCPNPLKCLSWVSFQKQLQALKSKSS